MSRTRGEENMITTTVRVEAKTLENLKVAARSIGMGQSDFIRFAIMAMTTRTQKGILGGAGQSQKNDTLYDLQDNPHFRDFAEQKMAEGRDFWIHESREGVGFMADVAKAIVAVGDTRVEE